MLKIKRDWQKRFSDVMQKEIAQYAKEDATQDDRNVLLGIKNTIYLLGEAMNEKEYRWANGFLKFCDELGIDLKR